MKNKLLKYIHPSACGYSSDTTYNLDELLKSEMSVDKIKVLFSPIGWKWNDLEKKKASKKSNKNKNIIEKE